MTQKLDSVAAAFTFPVSEQMQGDAMAMLGVVAKSGPAGTGREFTPHIIIVLLGREDEVRAEAAQSKAGILQNLLPPNIGRPF
jgi:hypothetical protein